MSATSTTERNKDVVRQLVDEVLNGGHLDKVDEFYAPSLAKAARHWIEPFQKSFPDMQMRVIELVAEGDKVVGHFTCSATHLGEWLGYAPTGRRFENINEVYIFQLREGRVVRAWGIEDTLGRLEQLGLR